MNGSVLAVIGSAVLLLIALFPAFAALFTVFAIFLIMLFTAIATFSSILDQLDGCGGDVGVGMALIISVQYFIPSPNAASIRIFIESFIGAGGLTAGETAVCGL